MSNFWLIFVDSNGARHRLNYSLNQYPSLMGLIVNELFEDIGDCKGRAWCGTCLVELIFTSIPGHVEFEEQSKLDEFVFSTDSEYRLSCQLQLNEDLNKSIWRVSEGRNLL